MVRRGSTVRVRQTVPAKAPHTRGFHFLDLLHLVQFAQVWNRFWNTQTKKPLVLSSSSATTRTYPIPGSRSQWVTTEPPRDVEVAREELVHATDRRTFAQVEPGERIVTLREC